MSGRKRAEDAETLAGADVRVGVSGSVVAVAGTLFAMPDSLRGTVAAGESVLSVEDLQARVGGGQRYLPVRELGQGGMGRVDVVFDRALGRPIARKRLLDVRHAGLLQSEAQIGAQLEHPAIVPVYDVDCDAEGRPEYTMRLVNGRTLRTVLDDERMGGTSKRGLVQLLGIVRQVCLALDYAHSRGVVHRDVKPDNIVVGEFGEVYVLDWGVACLMPSSDIRLAGSAPEILIAGSPGYMAPEQSTGALVDGRADVYALGVLLYEVLTGRSPFPGEEDFSGVVLRTQRPTVPPPSLAADQGEIPSAFDELVRRCLKRSAVDRPSARAIAEAIDQFLDGERERRDREREALERIAEGEAALATHAALEQEAAELDASSEAMLDALEPWESAERKTPAWSLGEKARRLRVQAARELAGAEAGFTTALSKVPGHARARASLAGLHFRSFLESEAAGDADGIALHLELARRYDDGTFALELAGEGTLEVGASEPGVELQLFRYEPCGLLLKVSEPRRLRERRLELLRAGSYLVIARKGAREVRCPARIERAKHHRLSLRLPEPDELPNGMVLVPGGPFLGYLPKSKRMGMLVLPDFAIGRFPVTFGEYIDFLEAVGDAVEHIPGRRPLLLRGPDGRWSVSEHCVEGDAARARISGGREFQVPVHEVRWHSAQAFASWRAERDGRRYRLPTDLEWGKAARGADGRHFPMGNHLDPSFAKLRTSRPEATQVEPIGAFPLDESPYGVRDLAGGVADWTSTLVDGGPAPGANDAAVPSSERQAYWRGGYWGQLTVPPQMRYPMAISQHTTGVGFRLALSLDESVSSSLETEPMR